MSKFNDHYALTAERRDEIDNLVAQFELFQMQAPGAPLPNVDGQMLVDAMSHIGVLDHRNRVFSNIFQAIQDLADRLGGTSDGTVVDAHEMAEMLTATVQSVLTPQKGAGG